MKSDIICPKCESRKVFYLRIDSDWGYGAGDYSILNDEKYYTKEELNYDACDRPDISLFHCVECNHMWQ